MFVTFFVGLDLNFLLIYIFKLKHFCLYHYEKHFILAIIAQRMQAIILKTNRSKKLKVLLRQSYNCYIEKNIKAKLILLF